MEKPKKRRGEKPPPGIYKVGSILSAKNAWRDKLLMEYGGEEISVETMSEMVCSLEELIPEAIGENLTLSVEHLLGETVTQDLLDELCWRLAANRGRLQTGPVRPWTSQADVEWCAVQVINGRRVWRNDRPGAMLQFRFLSGSPAGRSNELFWSLKLAHFFRKDFGFTYEMPLSSPLEYVSLRFLALVAPEFSKAGPGFERLSMPGAALKWNKRVIQMRYRRGFDCPYHYQHACHLCPLGYVGDQAGKSCVAAVRPRSCVEKFCPVCKKTGWFDPTVNARRCLGCEQTREPTQQKQE